MSEPDSESDDQRAAEAWYERKSAIMEEILGPEHDMVMHAIIPYAIGGGLDLYYHVQGLPGTAIATKELSEVEYDGAFNDVFANYELVMFTRLQLDMEAAQDESTPFGRMHLRMSRLLNAIARFSAEALLNPHETCEFPPEIEEVGGCCLIFDGMVNEAAMSEVAGEGEEAETEDEAADVPEGKRFDFGLLVLIEVFRSEMELAREQGVEALIDRLEEAGHYPYSDLDREPVA